MSGDDSRTRITHKAHGMRGPEVSIAKPEGTYRILCLGGSSTYGHGPTSNETTWPARLEAFETLMTVVRRVAVERGALLADPRSVLEAGRARQMAESGTDSLFVHEVHVTDEGARLIARSFAETILAAGVLE